MFGSKDKPESPENKAADSAAKPEKKGLFGWARRKEAPAPEPEQDAPAPLSQQLDSVEAREQAAREAAASLFSELGQSAAEPVAEPQPLG